MFILFILKLFVDTFVSFLRRGVIIISLSIDNIDNSFRFINDNPKKSVAYHVVSNQSVGNAGVAFVMRANERNEFFEKVNKQ